MSTIKKDRDYYLRRLGRRRWTLKERLATAVVMFYAVFFSALVLWIVMFFIAPRAFMMFPIIFLANFSVAFQMMLWTAGAFFLIGFFAPETANSIFGKFFDSLSETIKELRFRE